MRTKTSQQVRVGLFVFLGLVSALSVILFLGGGSSFFERKYILHARFTDVNGLRLDAPVFLAGIQVGKVEKINFTEELEDRRVVVDMEIIQRYKDRIRADSDVTLLTQGLLGDKGLFISLGSPQQPMLENDHFLLVKKSASFESLAEKGTSLIENVDKIVMDLQTEKGILHALIYEPTGKEFVTNLNRVSENANKILKDVRGGRGVLHSLIYDPIKRDVGQSVGEALENFRSVGENFKSISKKIDKGDGTVGGLINDPTVYHDLMTLLGKANRNLLVRTVIRSTLAANEKDLIQP